VARLVSQAAGQGAARATRSSSSWSGQGTCTLRTRHEVKQAQGRDLMQQHAWLVTMPALASPACACAGHGLCLLVIAVAAAAWVLRSGHCL
jgi:hypothetical protein